MCGVEVLGLVGCLSPRQARPPWPVLSFQTPRSAWALHTSSARHLLADGQRPECVHDEDSEEIRTSDFSDSCILQNGHSQGQGLVTATLRLPKHSSCHRPPNLPWWTSAAAHACPLSIQVLCGHLSPGSAALITWRPAGDDGIRSRSPGEASAPCYYSKWEFSATVVIELQLWGGDSSQSQGHSAFGDTTSAYTQSHQPWFKPAVPFTITCIQFSSADLIVFCLCPKEQKCLFWKLSL